jgi:hypothetical protein
MNSSTRGKRHALIVSFFVAVLCLSCNERKSVSSLPPPPRGVLSADSLAILLADLQVFEAAIRSRETRRDGLQDEARLAYLNYFDTVGISEERFKTSLNFWKDDLFVMEQIFDQSMEILSTRMAKAKQRADTTETPVKTSI